MNESSPAVELTPRAVDLYRELSDGVEALDGQVPCANAPDLFFPEKHDSAIGLKHINSAKSLCAVCPLAAVCAEYAIEAKELHGIWGGLTLNERKAIGQRYRSARRAS